MPSELEGRFAVYYSEGKQTRLSLNSIKTNWGSSVALAILRNKELVLGLSRFELELLPDEESKEEGIK